MTTQTYILAMTDPIIQEEKQIFQNQHTTHNKTAMLKLEKRRERRGEKLIVILQKKVRKFMH